MPAASLSAARTVLATIEAAAARCFSVEWSSAGWRGFVAKASRPMCPGGFPLRPKALCSEAINEANPDEEPMEYLHTMIRVTDLKATIAFFELMGFVETRRIENEKARYHARVPRRAR